MWVWQVWDEWEGWEYTGNKQCCLFHFKISETGKFSIGEEFGGNYCSAPNPNSVVRLKTYAWFIFWLQLKHFYQNSIFINTLIINTCLVFRCVWFHPITIIGYKWFYKHCHIAHCCSWHGKFLLGPTSGLSLLTMIHYHNGYFPITLFICVTSKPGKQCFSMENCKHTIRHPYNCRNLPHDIFLVVFDLLWFGLWHHCKWVVDCNISMLYFWPRSWK